MKNGAKEILGKTISAVCIRRQTLTMAKTQLFLTFTDGTAYEFYTDDTGGLHNTSGLYRAPFDVDSYISEGAEVVWRADL